MKKLSSICKRSNRKEAYLKTREKKNCINSSDLQEFHNWFSIMNFKSLKCQSTSLFIFY